MFTIACSPVRFAAFLDSLKTRHDSTVRAGAHTGEYEVSGHGVVAALSYVSGTLAVKVMKHPFIVSVGFIQTQLNENLNSLPA